MLLSLPIASAQTYTLEQDGDKARCNERTMKMPLTLGACKEAAAAMGRPFKTVEIQHANGPICAVDADASGGDVKYNGGGIVDSDWGGNEFAVCERIELGSGEAWPPFGPPPPPAPEGRRGRGGFTVSSLLLPVVLLVFLPLACYLQKMKMQHRAARVEQMRQQQMAAAGPGGSTIAIAQAQAMPVAPAPQTVSVACPPGSYPGDSVALSMPNGQQVTVQIPDGVGPGDSFMVQAPQAPVVLTAVAVPMPAPVV